MNAAQKMYNEAIDRFKTYIDSIDTLDDDVVINLYKSTFGYFADTFSREYYSPANAKNSELRILDCRFNNNPEPSGLSKKQLKDLVNKFLAEVPPGYMHYNGLNFVKVTPRYTKDELVAKIKNRMETLLLMTVAKGNRQALEDLINFSSTFAEVTKK